MHVLLNLYFGYKYQLLIFDYVEMKVPGIYELIHDWICLNNKNNCHILRSELSTGYLCL
jgi:hypothetical protein